MIWEDMEKIKLKILHFQWNKANNYVIYQIILFLDDILINLKVNLKYDQFILWGRSMGSTTILKMIVDY
jgi:hypothetical protein